MWGWETGEKGKKERKKKEGWRVRGRESFTLISFFLRIVVRCQPLWKIALFFIFAKYPFLAL